MNTARYDNITVTDSFISFFDGSSEGSRVVVEGNDEFIDKMSAIGVHLDGGPCSVMYLGGSKTGMTDNELRAWLDFGVRLGIFICLDAMREVFAHCTYEA